jgi:hypothetical protein
MYELLQQDRDTPEHAVLLRAFRPGGRSVSLDQFSGALQHAHLYRGELFTIEGTRLGHFVNIEGLAEAIHLGLKQQLDVAL